MNPEDDGSDTRIISNNVEVKISVDHQKSSSLLGSKSDPVSRKQSIIENKLTEDDDKLLCDNPDDLLKMCGDEGVWQILVLLLGSLCGFNTAMHSFVFPFIADTGEFSCMLPNFTNFSKEEAKSLLIPKDKTGSFEKCKQYEYTYINKTSNSRTIINISKRIITCDKRNFEQKDFLNSIASEWDLVCENSFWLSSIQSLFMMGLLIGSVMFGSFSDKYGRKQGIWISSFIFILSAPMVALSTNYYTLLFSRFFLGLSSSGLYSISYVAVVEFIGARRRGLAGLLYSIPFALGYTFLPIFAYFIRDWRYLQLTLSALSPLLLVSWWYIPESPRWLLSLGRTKEAEYILRNVARINGKSQDLPKKFGELVEKVATQKRKEKRSLCHKVKDCSISVIGLFQHRRLRLRTLVIASSFFAISMVYYGISMDAKNLRIDIYLFTFLCGLFGIPATVSTTPLINSLLGRRITFAGLIILSGTSLLLSLLFAPGSIMSIVLAVIAQFFIAASSSLIYLYSSEMFPTVIRSYGLGFALMLGRLGSVSAPYIVGLLGEKHHTYPTMIFGGTALVSGILAILLPETRNQKLPETIEEVELS